MLGKFKKKKKNTSVYLTMEKITFPTKAELNLQRVPFSECDAILAGSQPHDESQSSAQIPGIPWLKPRER